MGEETKLPKRKEAAYSYCNCGSHLALVKNTSVFICYANGQMAGRLAAYSLPFVLHTPPKKNNLVHEIYCSAGKGTGPQPYCSSIKSLQVVYVSIFHKNTDVYHHRVFNKQNLAPQPVFSACFVASPPSPIGEPSKLFLVRRHVYVCLYMCVHLCVCICACVHIPTCVGQGTNPVVIPYGISFLWWRWCGSLTW